MLSMEISPRPRPVEPPADRPHLMSENMAMARPLDTLPPDSSPTKANRSRDERLVFRKPVQPASASRPTRVPSIKTDLLDRRRSVQREGPPLGPRPLERVGGKRYAICPGSTPALLTDALGSLVQARLQATDPPPFHSPRACQSLTKSWILPARARGKVLASYLVCYHR